MHMFYVCSLVVHYRHTHTHTDKGTESLRDTECAYGTLYIPSEKSRKDV